MHFVVVGLNHKTAPVEIREKLYFSEEEIPQALNTLNTYPAIKGCVILSTCNRIEIYASADIIEDGFKQIADFISAFKNINNEILAPILYKKNCQQAVTHLLKVSSSIDSMVVGEYQIQGQVRDAYTLANESGATNGIINKLFQTAISVGKRVRSETEIGKGSISVATLAIELIKQVIENEHDFSVLLVGAGKMSNLAANNLQQFKSCKLSITNRSYEKAVALADKHLGTPISYENRHLAAADTDIIIVSTSSDCYTINANAIKSAIESNPEKSRIFIDLSIPRNVDPAINDFENCLVYSIDDINNLKDLNINKRSLEISKAEEIIHEVSGEYYDWYYKQFIIPTMREIKGDLNILKQRTIATYKNEFGSMESSQQELIDKMLDSYSDKLIKVIMKNIKNSTTNEDLVTIIQNLRKTFTIDINE